ncbi:1,4-dihydroxy-2-naphthoate polyprenyltransferase [Rapidithrix thailandica]|uniref:1,4-dihydroxy-2-naphthoate octaprenyltransferase n=1 Tax=Rapidithrix thailandica TaxID=413964 RepID=A0AAW9RYX7_9BACT
MNIKVWIEAFRLRTLPLALSSIAMGSFLAAGQQAFRWEVFVLSVTTTLFLQILSNLANDYGDSVHGADSAERSGPSRAVQAGKITPQAMKTAMGVFVLLSLVSGISLLLIAVGIEKMKIILLFFLLGIVSIWAAVKYTAGKNPYGYAGLGDISVMVFFGFVGVLGTMYLHTGGLSAMHLLPAASCGLFATAVLNVNNIRDIESDEKAGKRSIPVRIGRSNAVFYHWTLLGVGIACGVAYVFLNYTSSYQWLFLVTLPLLWRNASAVRQFKQPAQLDPFLKQMALTTLLFVLTFGLGQML